ncbi:hypothetical protein MKY15_20755 [Sporosarcina sp. FSL K6-1540]|uniref:hypothetical protein n=1 Tax=Sporosarcina sp. FSL K6-1540 TaxID=2921555 RepID=UPI00315B055C
MNIEWHWQQENAKLRIENHELRKKLELFSGNRLITEQAPVIAKKNRWTDEEREIAKKNGLSANHMNLVSARIGKGWTREEALNTPKMSLEEQAERIGEGTRAYHERRKKNECM